MNTLMLDLDHAAFVTPGGTEKEKHSSHQGPFLRKRFKPFYLRAIHQQDMRYLPNQNIKLRKINYKISFFKKISRRFMLRKRSEL